MGSTTSTSESTASVPGAGQQELQARNLLMQLAESGQGQLDMSQLGQLSSGDLNISPQDQDLVRQIAQLTGDLQRSQAQSNYETMAGSVEGQMLDRGMEGSSIEAVSQALLGRQLQQSLDQGAMQNQITSSQMLQQMPFQRAGIQLSANQQLLQQILGGAQAVGGMGLQERLSQRTSTETTETPFNWGSAVGSALGTAAGAAFGGPAGAVGAQAGNAAFTPGAANNPYHGPGY